jgi:ABC-type multidrug transport system fused ATPase/permease subunit
LSTAISENIITFREAIGTELTLVIHRATTFICGISVSLGYLWPLTLVSLSLTPLLALASFCMIRTMKSKIERQLQAFSQAGAVAEETLQHIRTVTSLGVQERQVEKFSEKLKPALENIQLQNIVSDFGSGFTMGILSCVIGLAYYAGGTFIAQSRYNAELSYPLARVVALNATQEFCAVGRVIPDFCIQGTTQFNNTLIFESPADVCACKYCGCGCFPDPNVFGSQATGSCVTGGVVVAAFFAVFYGSLCLGQLAPGMIAIMNGKIAAQRIYDIIEQERKIQEGTEIIEKPQGHIVFKNVDFVYPTRKEVNVFQDFNLVIPTGKRMGIVGPSGSGKSTLVQLLLRYYNPLGGNILLDGVDIKTLDVQWYRSKIGLVSQEPILFATSIRENVRFGNPSATDEEVYEACRAANASDFISTFPEKYNTQVGAFGNQMSGGQKQRLCLARAFIRKPLIMIADEATSALE